MKVLILTGSTGGGHNSSALILQENLAKQNIDSKIYDITAMAEGINNTPSTSYETVIKYIPSVYRGVYNFSNNKVVRLLANFISESSVSLYLMICRYKPDVIVSVHPVSISMLQYFRKKGKKLKMPFIQVLTDFHAHEVYVDEDVTKYITPSEYTNLSLSKRKEVLITDTYAYGIPIEDKFILSHDEAKKEITNDILILLGSMGYEGNIKKIYDLIDQDNKRNYTFVVGKNKKLKSKLERRYKSRIKSGKLTVLGWVENISDLMKSADIVITKPGGRSLTECINLKKPMILVNPIPGQEEQNAKIMNTYNIGINSHKKELYPIVEELYSDPQNIYSMLEGLDRLTRDYSQENIIDLIIKVHEDNIKKCKGNDKMNKIILQANNKAELESKIKSTLNLASNETYTIKELKKPINFLFIHTKGKYEITILDKKELANIKKAEEKAKEKKEVIIKKQDNKKVEKTEKVEKKEVKQNNDDEIIDLVKTKIQNLLNSLQLDINLVSTEKKGHLIFVNLEGKDVKYIIGEKGIALNSLEYLLNSTRDLRHLKIILDANGYRAKREKSLLNLANKKAKKVIETKGYVKLSPMSSKERRIIHEELSKYPELETQSHGNEPKRYLVIKYIGE